MKSPYTRYDKSKGSQEKQIAQSFAERAKTRTMVYQQTGVPVKNIDRYIAKMKKTGILRVVAIGVCEVTKHPKVEYLTNNPVYYPKGAPEQLNLFD